MEKMNFTSLLRLCTNKSVFFGFVPTLPGIIGTIEAKCEKRKGLYVTSGCLMRVRAMNPPARAVAKRPVAINGQT